MKRAPYSIRVIDELLKHSEALGLGNSARLRLTWFSFAARHAWNVSKTCRHFGIATSTFMRWIRRFDPQNVRTLESLPHRPKKTSGTNLDQTTVAFIERCRRESPYMSNSTIRQRLAEECRVNISNATVGRIVQRYCFFFGSTPAHREKARQFHEKHDTTAPTYHADLPDRDNDDAGNLMCPACIPACTG